AIEETKAKHVSKDELRRELLALQASWPEVCEKVRKQIMPFSEIKAKLEAVGAPTTPEQICVTRERLRRTLHYLPYMRSRFNNFDVIYRFGLMDELEKDLFGPQGVWGKN
ncbi:MAG: sn-glycerol-1-phosphate dehydrogenase, partial [Bacteroidales bacterium]|nr:sn-glycerol-1-phosphate dehydrogenase [Bacteroidales bacterium]